MLICFTLPFHIINIFTPLSPSYSFYLDILRLINVRFHPSVIECLGFLKITNVETISTVFAYFAYLEIVPLQMTSCIRVYSHKTIVFIRSHLIIK